LVVLSFLERHGTYITIIGELAKWEELDSSNGKATGDGKLSDFIRCFIF
jgi:hypothetical protein